MKALLGQRHERLLRRGINMNLYRAVEGVGLRHWIISVVHVGLVLDRYRREHCIVVVLWNGSELFVRVEDDDREEVGQRRIRRRERLGFDILNDITGCWLFLLASDEPP